MSGPRVPSSLLEAVRSDLQPVHPFAPPGRRALALLPLGIAVLIGIPAFWTWWSHLRVLAPPSSWLVSPIEIGFSLVILAATFRESIPGRELSLVQVAAIVGVAVMLFLIANPMLPPSGQFSSDLLQHWIVECIFRATAFSVPALILPMLLLARGLPNRPALAGALCGLAVGFMGDAGLRLLCWDGEYAHVIYAHAGAIVIAMVIGTLVSITCSNRRRH
ncbi:MAG TPA: NrsF family protein [Steroidobacter sp.]